MKKMYKYIPLMMLLALVSGLQSCYKDLGNYDYIDLGDIQIDSIKVHYGEVKLFEDSLIINPFITFGEEGNEHFSGEWFRVTDKGMISVANTIELRLQMTTSGRNRFVFRATHNELGLTSLKETKIDVVSDMERGFYILKETAEGNTDMDAFIRIGTEGDIDFMPDLIATTQGAPLEGAPVDVDYWDWLWSQEVNGAAQVETVRAIRPMSEKELAIFNIKSFTYLGDLNTMLVDELPKEGLKLEAMSSVNGLTALFYNGGKLQTLRNSGTNSTSRFGSEYLGDFELEPQMVTTPASGNNGTAFVFDKKSSSIKAISSAVGNTLRTLRDTGMNIMPVYYPGYSPCKVNDLDVNLKHCGYYNTGKGIPPLNSADGVAAFLCEMKTAPDSLLLYHLSLTSSQRGMQDLLSLYQTDTLTNIRNLRRAELYAFAMSGKYLYFTIGSKIYYYDFTLMNDGELMDFAGEEITYMRHIRWNSETVTDYNFDCLVVGTYANGRYKVYFQKLSGGYPTGETKIVLEGDGKMKSFVYASPTTSSGGFGVYH